MSLNRVLFDLFYFVAFNRAGCAESELQQVLDILRNDVPNTCAIHLTGKVNRLSDVEFECEIQVRPDIEEDWTYNLDGSCTKTITVKRAEPECDIEAQQQCKQWP